MALKIIGIEAFKLKKKPTIKVDYMTHMSSEAIQAVCDKETSIYVIRW